MGESVTPWSPFCNGFVHVQVSGDATTSDAGRLVLCEALNTSGEIDTLTYHLVDSRDPQHCPPR